ncbi:MAG: hypothetical protein L3K03_07470 [Thermoplasmata archaeon]|nr:hypothetical protein [Thermoplasmata archaeon]
MLFSSVFYFVNTFPQAPAQPIGQFNAFLTYVDNGQLVSNLEIQHLAGPSLVEGHTQVWITSARHPGVFTSPFDILAGLPGQEDWQIGETWAVNLTSYHVYMPDNITVAIIAGTELVFQTVIPGAPPTTPPQFVGYSTFPSSPLTENQFSLIVQVLDYHGLGAGAVTVNLSQFPGGAGSSQENMTFASVNDSWWFVVPAVLTGQVGTYYAYVTASDVDNYNNTIAIPVKITTTTAVGPLQVSVTLNVSNPYTCIAPATCHPSYTVIGTIHNSGAIAGLLNTTFYSGVSAFSSLSGTPITAGGTILLDAIWSPSNQGTVDLNVETSSPTIGLGIGTHVATVFPSLYLLAWNGAAGLATTDSNDSGLVGNELTAAGVPYTTSYLGCGTTLPVAATFELYNSVIIDGGSNTSRCQTVNGGELKTTDGANIEKAALKGVNFWLVGQNMWGNGSAAACPSTNANFYAVFGLTETASTKGCTNTVNFAAGHSQLLGGALGQVQYTGNLNLGLRLDGSTNSSSLYWGLNDTIAESWRTSAHVFDQYQGLGPMLPKMPVANLTSSTPQIVGSAYVCPNSLCVGTANMVITTFDPFQLATSLYPGSSEYANGQAGTELVYNIVNWLDGMSSRTTSGRGQIDESIDQVVVVGTLHGSVTTFWAGLRENGGTGGTIVAQLFVNGQPAVSTGSYVTWAGSLPARFGSTDFVPLYWTAPRAGPYTISVVISEAGDTNPIDDTATPWLITANPVVFT